MGVRSDLEANFDFDLIDEFLDHYSMMVESMEIMVLDLAKPNEYERSVNELFRVFHNIKSASGFLKILPMAKLSTFVENELEELRAKNKPISEETITWLLEISDMYSQWQEDLRLDNELSKIKYSLLKIPDLEK
ncbi:MAG: chemotaxis protein CheA [Helicobacteraceae bacterium CG2_30_36_10]|nr:MAG: chemotaxis protein CheA [Helicobacteraceae bacterium CG2_30_36_10]